MVPPTPLQAQLPLTEEEKEFIHMLQEDLVRINSYFIEQEEEAVIKLHALRDRRAIVDCSEQTNKQAMESLRAEFIDFHGEMVLLLHWSLVNYAGIVKILKKHDKLLGGHAQRVFLQNVLQQPFTSTESISRLVRDAEEQVQNLSGVSSAPQTTGGGRIEVEDRGEEASLLK
jgi:SPX domain protein involved in polyphosphate accumulation